MTFRTLAAAAAASLLLTAGVAGTASAQEATPAPVEMEVSAEKLERFAVAYLEVVRIGDTYQGQLEAASTDEARAAIQQDAQQAMVAAVDDTDGLTVEEYSLIFTLVQSDPELANRVQGHIDSLAAQ
jgi:hypothetical protein